MLPFYMGLDAGCHNAVTAHLLATNGIEGVIGYRCHIYVEDYFGKWCFSCDSYFDAYLCSVKEPLYWKTATREGCRQYISDSKKCALCPMWEQCFSSKATRKKVIWHVWQDALDDITIFSKTTLGKRIYRWRKETIERSFALGPSFSFVSTSSYLKGRASTFGNTAFVDVVRAAIRRRATLSDFFAAA